MPLGSQVQRMRLQIMRPLREDHGFRLHEQGQADAAPAHALSTRLAWARGSWLLPAAAAATLLQKGSFLRSVSVTTDPWSARALEALVRCNVGLQGRAFALWSGGVYRLVQLASPDAREVSATNKP